jgi:NAD(P)-dependent dehydrogenase (short-subunit alcohol dehydrogenase family)
VVTGAGSGIGRSIAQVFAARGAKVHIFEMDEAGGAETVDLIAAADGTAEAHVCDVTSQASVKMAYEAVSAGGDRVDILVNNAGIGHVGTVETTTEEDLDRLYAVNVKGIYNCLHLGVPIMREQGAGVILNLASIASLVGVEDRFAYSMTKGAVLTMTLSTAVDYVKMNIRCNCVCPARIHTPFVDEYLKKNYPGEEEAMFKKLAEYQPIGRMGTPEEVAQLVLYLCSDEASFITGQAYGFDGGVLAF